MSSTDVRVLWRVREIAGDAVAYMSREVYLMVDV